MSGFLRKKSQGLSDLDLDSARRPQNLPRDPSRGRGNAALAERLRSGPDAGPEVTQEALEAGEDLGSIDASPVQEPPTDGGGDTASGGKGASEAGGDTARKGETEGRSALVDKDVSGDEAWIARLLEEQEADDASPTDPTADRLPEAPADAARAGVVVQGFDQALFQSRGALGYIDLGSGKANAPRLEWKTSPFTAKDDDDNVLHQVQFENTFAVDAVYTVQAAAPGKYDMGSTVNVPVNGRPRTVRRVLEVTASDAGEIARFEQQHIDDTVVAYQMSFGAIAAAMNQWADSGIWFRDVDEDSAKAYAMSRLQDDVNPKIGTSVAEWGAAYLGLVRLTVSERDGTGSHTWGVGRKPRVEGDTAIYSLLPPGTSAGPSFTVISWDKI